MRPLLITILAAVFAAGTPAQKATQAEIDIRAAIQLWGQAVRKRDVALLDSLFANDLFITDYTGATRNKRAEIDALRPGDSKPTIVMVANDDIKVRLYDRDRVAVVTAIVRMLFEAPGGGTSPLSMRYTSVWERRRGDWQLKVLQTARVPTK